MDLDIPRCAITGCPNKSKVQLLTFTPYIESQNITYYHQFLPILSQNDPYIYLGIKVISLLKWNLQKHVTIETIKKQSTLFLTSLASLQQKN